MSVHYVPVKLRQDRRARGWKPAPGWYVWSVHTGARTDRGAFATKRDCLTECASLNTNEEAAALRPIRRNP